MSGAPGRRAPSGPVVVAVAFAAGIVISVILSLLTSLIAYWGPHGHSYFLGGNSALQFSAELAPAFLGAGWTTLALHSRGRRHASLLGIGAGLVSVVTTTLYWVVAISRGFDLGLLLILGGLWNLAAPVLALTLPIEGETPEGARREVQPGWYVAAAVVLLVAVVSTAIGLQSCGPALGLPEGARQLTVCVPFRG